MSGTRDPHFGKPPAATPPPAFLRAVVTRPFTYRGRLFKPGDVFSPHGPDAAEVLAIPGIENHVTLKT